MKQIITGKYIPDHLSTRNKKLKAHAIWAKRMELAALETKKKNNGPPDTKERHMVYWDAKAQAFAQAWEHALTGGIHFTPQQYNMVNEAWCEAIAKEIEDQRPDGVD